MGVETSISLENLVRAGMLAQKLVGRKLPGRALAALAAEYENKDAMLQKKG